MRTFRWSQCLLVVVLIVPFAFPQSAPDASPRAPNPQATANADQVANILGISQLSAAPTACTRRRPANLRRRSRSLRCGRTFWRP
jgi:hypothetical protein